MTTNPAHIQPPSQAEPVESMTAPLRVLERALVSSNAGIIITDALQPDHPVIYVNPAMERISGYPSAEFAGRNCRFLRAPGCDEPELARLRKALATGESCRVTLLNQRKDGVTFWNDLAISPCATRAGASRISSALRKTSPNASGPKKRCGRARNSSVRWWKLPAR